MRSLLFNVAVALIVCSTTSHFSFAHANIIDQKRANYSNRIAENRQSSPQTTDSTKAKKTKAPSEENSSGTSATGHSRNLADSHAIKSSIESALESGDWELALEIARSRRRSHKSSETWLGEAEILLRMGNYMAAKTAYEQALKLAEQSGATTHEGETSQNLSQEIKDADHIRQELSKLELLSRGRDRREPASRNSPHLQPSTSELSLQRSKAPKEKIVASPLPHNDVAGKKIIRSWYFWATIGAIAAAGATIAVVSIKADRTKSSDSLSTNRRSLTFQVPTLAF